MMRLWADVRARLDLVDCPILLLRSDADDVVPAISRDIVLRQVSSEEITEVALPDSRHVAPLDHDAELIVSSTLEFLAGHVRR